jgi:ethanolamine utilization cobalamin adenosyltransferase
VPKSHPRIRLRGLIDSLHALVGMAQHRAGALQHSWLEEELGKLGAHCRELVSAEYNERRVQPLSLDGLSAVELHAASHDPASFGVEHLLLDGHSPELLHWLNIIRARSREVELAAYEAFPYSSQDFESSLIEALNVFSCGAYYLQLKIAATSRQGYQSGQTEA